MGNQPSRLKVQAEVGDGRALNLPSVPKRPWVKVQIVPPVNIPIPTKIWTETGGAPTPKWDPIGFDNHSQIGPALGERGGAGGLLGPFHRLHRGLARQGVDPFFDSVARLVFFPSNGDSAINSMSAVWIGSPRS